MSLSFLLIQYCWPISAPLVVEYFVISTVDLGLNSWICPIEGAVPNNSPLPFLCCCVALALSRGDGPQHSLHAFAKTAGIMKILFLASNLRE